MAKTSLSKKDMTHQHIVEKSAQLFNSKGYAATSITDIMEATGLKKGGIYSHFKSKDEIEIAAFDHLLTKIFTSFDPSVLNNKTTAGKLYALIEYRESLYDSFLKGGCPIFNAGSESDESNKKLQAHVKRNIERWKNTIMEIVKAGIINNDVDQAVDPEEFALYYITIIEGGNFLSKVYDDRSYRAKAIERLKRTIKEEIAK
jgi:AcrR family transcriptional regulator